MSTRRLTLSLLTTLGLALVSVAGASAAPSAALGIHSLALPTRFSAMETAACEATTRKEEPVCNSYAVSVTNVGSEATDGTPITLTDTLPPEVSVSVNASGVPQLLLTNSGGSEGENLAHEFCAVSAGTVVCRVPQTLVPDERLRLIIPVDVAPNAAGTLTNTATVVGGGAADASTTVANPNGGPAPLFGVGFLSSDVTGPDGSLDTQAGDHPYEYTTRIDFNTVTREMPSGIFGVTSVQDVRDVVLDLPLGLLGSATSTPTCTAAELAGTQPPSAPSGKGLGGCPTDTQVGRIRTDSPNGGSVVGPADVHGPLFNMEPPPGVAAAFGFVDALKVTHRIYASVVPTPTGYVLRAITREIPQIPLQDTVVTFFGDPGARDAGASGQRAQFTNPSDCSGTPGKTIAHVDSWQSPGAYTSEGVPNFSDPNWASATTESPPVTGCNLLHFSASLSAQPETTAADSPTGLNVDLKVPQTEAPGSLATPPLRNATVTLPAGVTVNPSSANGLASCSESQIGFIGHTITDFTPSSPGCPDASKIGTVELATPLLNGTLVGSIYLAAQDENPFHSLLAGYIVVDDPTTGTIVKIPGELKTDPNTGQITGVFNENPQLPFSDLKLHFFGGSRGELATPQACGTFTTTSDLMPWSAPESGPDATPSSSFEITSNCGGSFAPSFSAGTVSTQAGGFSPFTLTLARNDGEQHLTGLTVTTPPGLLGVLKSVVQCLEPQASQGQCGPESQIGETTVASGVGPDPFWVKGGRVYLTGPYNGGPFGLSIVVPAVAGPFNLGNVVVRASIRVNPVTSQITVISDPLPQMINSVEGRHSGIPTDIRTVNVTINRPGFMFNPTNCAPLAVTGTVAGAQGAAVPVSSGFQAANCANLPFNPTLTASTKGNASKANGAALVVKVASGQGQANIGKTRLVLPIALPSRLTTIQKACVDTVFEADPAACGEGSNVGTATVYTPILKNPLRGPAYLVSHGGAAFPDIEFVLQGEGITLILDGQTDIKKGITTSTFNAVPDAPVTSFEAVLPEGPHSALTSNVAQSKRFSLCGAKLVMPTTITGQNGAVIKQETNVAVQGCAAVKTLKTTRAQKLKKAISKCRRLKKAKRAGCERLARKRYGRTDKSKKKKKK
jgi:hypothetical protein